MPPEQMGKACVPDRIGAAREHERFSIGGRDHDEAAKAELGEGGARSMNLRPDRAIALHTKPGFVGRIETDHVEIAPCRALRAVRRMHAVPNRRMWFLQRLDLHGTLPNE